MTSVLENQWRHNTTRQEKEHMDLFESFLQFFELNFCQINLDNISSLSLIDF